MSTKRPAPNWSKLREALWERSGGRCEVSGRPLDQDTFDAHHRRLKGMGGTYRPLTDSLCNLLALDPEVHNGAPWSIHQNSFWSRPRGYLVSAHVEDDALAATPVLYRGKDWVILLDGVPDFGVLELRSQRHLWRKLEEANGSLARATRPPHSQYR